MLKTAQNETRNRKNKYLLKLNLIFVWMVSTPS